MGVDQNEAVSRNELPGQPQTVQAPEKPRKRGRQGEGGGPKTPAGKARSSRNATKHGITSSLAVIPDMESEEEYALHRQGFFDSLQPEGHAEEFLTGQLASLAWRLKRVSRHEDAVVARQVAYVEHDQAAADAYMNAIAAPLENTEDDEDPEVTAAIQEFHIQNTREIRMIPIEPGREALMRYEGHLRRQFHQTLHELQALQDHRNGKPAFLGRFDVTASPMA